MSGIQTTDFDSFLKGNPASTAVMAAVVTMAGQVAAQLELPGKGCRLVAFGFAILLAVYQVAFAQRRPLRESFVLAPIVSVVLFTSGWGANGLIYEVDHRRMASPERVAEQAVAPASLPERVAAWVIPGAYAQQKGGQEGHKGGQSGRWKSW
jgi:hypothetical protein